MSPRRFLCLVWCVSVLTASNDSLQGQAPPLPSPNPTLPPVPNSTPPPLPPPSVPPVPAVQPTGSAPPAVSPPPVPPAPNPALILPPLPLPLLAQPSSAPSAAEIQRLTPIVEVWRAGALSPQVPLRHGRYVAPAFIADNQPVMVRLQFDPLARGKTVVVRPGKGAVLDPPTEVLQVRPTGECVVTVRLLENAPRAHLTFHCGGLMTTLPFSRNSLAKVQANENATAAGAR